MQTTCLNCETGYAGKFCPECGQKAHTNKITFGSILHEIPHSVFHLEKGLLHTFTQLLYRPGKAIKEYIDGRRVNHFAPFAYLFLICAVSSFIDHSFAEYTGAHFTKVEALAKMKSIGMLFPDTSLFSAKYPSVSFCAMIPFISIWSWLFNRDKGYNYWENIVLNTYLIAQFTFFFIIQSIVTLSMGQTTSWMTPMLISFFLYLIFAYTQFLSDSFSIGIIVKRIVMYILIILTLLTGLAVAGFMTPWWPR